MSHADPYTGEQTKTYDEPEWHIVVIGSESDAVPLLDAGYYGPFADSDRACEFARKWREAHGLPHANLHPTVEENEEWSDAGWTFAVKPLGTYIEGEDE